METKNTPTKEGAKKVAQMIIDDIENQGVEKYKVKKGLSTILVAGAPGAGKTEFIDTVLNTENFIVINIDKYRKFFEGYNGKNAGEYQDCSSRVATKIFDYCIRKGLKVIFDGTLTSRIGVKNIEKSHEKSRKIGVVLVYQDPAFSYSFTIARQIKNMRNVDIDTFMKLYYKSIEYCFTVVHTYTEIQFIVGSRTKDGKYKQIVIRDKEKFDKYFKVEYNSLALKEKLLYIQSNNNYISIIKGLWKKK